MNYDEFLKSKVIIARNSGMEICEDEINPALKPHQRDAVKWAVSGGKRALFESFGIGKTVQELEFCRILAAKENGFALIVMPLGVRNEFSHDAVALLGWPFRPFYVKTMEEVREQAAAVEQQMNETVLPYTEGSSRVMVTNYERVRDGDIEPEWFAVTSLDEASVLKSYGSKTYQTFLEKFKNVKYKLVATATPSPNKYKELLHYAGYLDVMDTGQGLTRFFKRDSTKANHLTLYPHKEEEFWLWVSTWALFMQKPSDLGYDDTGYDLPNMETRYHKLHASEDEIAVDRDGQTMLFRDAALGLKDAAREKRLSIDQRVSETMRLLVEYGAGSEVDEDGNVRQAVVWCMLNKEQTAVERALKKAGITYTSLTGSQGIDERESQMAQWKKRETAVLVTKPEMYGSGANLQQSSKMIFVGIDYQFEDFIQAVHREYRYGQKRTVTVDIIYMDTEEEILRTLMDKWANHENMQKKMTGILHEYGLGAREAEKQMQRAIGVERVEVTGKHYKAVLNDCILETKNMAENSVDMIVTSIPFSNHYEYTANYSDLGHNDDTEKFFEQMDFLAPSLLKALKPGRIFACHVKDRVLFGSQTGTGVPTIEPFHALTIAHYMKHGFLFIGMITVVRDVVRENNQTYRLGWSEQCRDGSKMGVGCPEYILLFRKQQSNHQKGFADEPVTKEKDEYSLGQWQLDAHAYWRDSGDRLVSREELEKLRDGALFRAYRKYSRETVYDYVDHVKLCKMLEDEGRLTKTFMTVPPGSWTDEVWDDIAYMRTLNTNQHLKKRMLHVCPLPLMIVERLINRYSNKGDTIYDPFGGLMTVPVCAVKLGRDGIGCELNADYFQDGVGYLEEADNKRDVPTLFDLLDMEEKPEDWDDLYEEEKRQLDMEKAQESCVDVN